MIPGEKIPTAPLNTRLPVWRIPGWLLVFVWLGRGTYRSVVLAARYWWITGPLVASWWITRTYGWPVLVGVVAGLGATGSAWWRLHPRTWLRFGWYPAVGRCRQLWTYRRGWVPVMTACGLASVHAGERWVPSLLGVRSDRWGDRVTVRLLPGQHPDDWAAAAPRLAYSFRLREARAYTAGRPDRVVLHFVRRDPLENTVGPLPVPALPDLSGLELGVREDGTAYRLRLTGSHVLIAGATNSGKGSVIWSLLRSLAAGIASGLVEVWAFDPKGGMELASGAPLFARFAYDEPEAMAGVLEEAVKRMRQRAARLRGVTRQHTPTVDEPLMVVIVDELAALTAYLTDRKVRDRIRESLGLLLSQGRAAGVHVVAALQDPRKDVLPFRDLFPTRIALRSPLMANKKGHRRFGNVRKLPSGRFQARYLGPDGIERKAPNTVDTERLAAQWRTLVESEIIRGEWQAPEAGDVHLARYGREWIAHRKLQPRTRENYEDLFRLHIEPTLGHLALGAIKPQTIRSWRGKLLEDGTSEPQAVKAYSLLRAVLNTAVREDEILKQSPCRIPGYDRYHTPERPVATVAQVLALAEQMPPRYVALITVAAFSRLRWGELAALRRCDVDMQGGTVRVPRKLAALKSGLEFGPPKSAAGIRVVALPAMARQALTRHLADFTGADPEALVFTGDKDMPLRTGNFRRAVKWSTALADAGMPVGFHFHDLRHTGNHLAAASGASTRELIHRMGHASMRTALIYQHATSERDREIAESMDKRIARSAKPKRAGQDKRRRREG
ncbi:hypothetical protein Ate01nite_53040 [Actinoplanes teichomyceticus]|nr:hypothetical protein Ate01nite_53040 [Actinoplanes teichomyceticus]